ncbi:MAG: class A beta-lactamase [Pseudomonadota bacterium]
MIDRRWVLKSLAALAAAGKVPSRAGTTDDIAALEQASGGRIGVGMLDAGTGAALGYRENERFGMCSTFKLPLAALILRAIDDGELQADRRIVFSEDDLVPHAPVTKPRLGGEGMTVLELAEAAQVRSDNVAANLLLKLLDGPEGLTRRLRALGDTDTRLDRYEPELNLVLPGEERDTTMPRAMARSVAALLDDQYLSARSRQRLEGWLVATRTGLNKLRAGMPGEWRVGDKTGTGIAPSMPNRSNDVATVWVAGRLFVVAAYVEADAHYNRMRPEDARVLASIGELASQWIAARLG